MNYRGMYLFLFALLSMVQPASAQVDSTQTSPNPVTIDMIRATVKFLGTDGKFGRGPRVPCQPCQSYEDLTQYVTQNRLLGADRLIIDARRQAQKALDANPATMPGVLRTFLLDRVTGGKHRYRRQLPSFAGYQQMLDATAGGTETPESPTIPPVVDESDDTAATANPDEPVITAENVASKTGAAPELMPHLSLITLVLSLISLIGVATLFWRRSRDTTASATPDSTSTLAEVEAKMKGLQTENRKLSDRLTTLEKRDRQPSNTIRSDQGAQTQPRPVQPPAPAPQESVAGVVPITPTPPPVDSPPAPVANTLRSVPSVQYGRTADLGDGFSVGGLVTAPDRDTVFEIHRQSDTTALYQVSDQPDLQRLALSDPYSYLTDTCTYLTQPRQGSRIQTDKPGKLSLQGDKWAIVEKAQISFQ